MNPWELVKQKLETAISQESFHNWFSRTRFHSVDGASLRVTVPDAQTKRWLENEYPDQILAAVRQLSIPVRSVEYEFGAGVMETVPDGTA